MAVSTAFKQQCPSCEAMVPVKEGMVGKKIECHKCKDRFVAEEPAQKKDSGKKKPDTRVTGKAPAAGKNGKKPPVEDDDEVEDLGVEIDEEDEVEEDDAPQTKSKGKPGANGKSKAPPAGKSKKSAEDDEETDEDADEDKSKKGKKKGAGSNKMTLGLALAGLGVVVLCVAAYFVLNGGGGGGGGGKNPIVAQQPIITEQPPVDAKIPIKPFTPPPADPVGTSLSDAEVARLSNLLPNDTEHVVHVGFKELFGPTSTLRDAAFQTPGALVDVELTRKLGFSPLSIDDLMRAERYSSPWSFTVLHFKDVVRERDVIDALNLTEAGGPIEGLTYYKFSEPNPWFDQLARFSFGISNQFAQFNGLSSGRATYVHFQNPQTIIVGDETPVLAFLKAKGQFPLLTPRGGGGQAPAGPGGLGGVSRGAERPIFTAFLENDQGLAQPPLGGGGGAGEFKIEGATFEGKEGADGKIRFKFAAGGVVTVDSSKANVTGAPGQWQAKPNNGAEITVPKVAGLSFEVSVDAMGKMTGMGKDAVGGMWPLELSPATAEVAPKTASGPNRDDLFLTIKPSLKAILDRMETRATGEKVLFSSATDMDAGRVTTNLPEFKDRIVRRPRQFWDVSLMVPESLPRIRMLGVSLIQRDNIKYQYRNEMTCGQEVDAKYIYKELRDRTTGQVARFVLKLTGHEIRLPQAKTAAPPVVGAEQPPPEKKDANASQITLSQVSNTVQFVLDVVLDNAALTQIHGITALTAAALRVEIEAAAAVSLRHTLAWAGKTLGEKGLADREIPEGKFPPAAFKRLDAPLRADREPKNRISWMAGLLPYLGHQNLYKKIQFEQSWRDPANWMAGRTVVPQFLDPMYPDSARFTAFSDLPIDFGASHFVGIAGVGLDAAAYNRRDPAVVHRRGVLGYDGSATVEEVRDGRGTSNTILLIQVPHDGLTGVSPWIAGGGATVRGVPEKNSIAPFVLSTDKTGKIIQHQKKRGTYALMTDGSVRFIDQNISDDVFKAMCTIGGPTPKDFDTDSNANAPIVAGPGGKKPIEKTPVKKVEEKNPADPKEEKKAVAPPAEKKPAAKDEKKVNPPPTKEAEPKKTSQAGPLLRSHRELQAVRQDLAWDHDQCAMS